MDDIKGKARRSFAACVEQKTEATHVKSFDDVEVRQSGPNRATATYFEDGNPTMIVDSVKQGNAARVTGADALGIDSATVNVKAGVTPATPDLSRPADERAMAAGIKIAAQCLTP